MSSAITIEDRGNSQLLSSEKVNSIEKEDEQKLLDKRLRLVVVVEFIYEF